MQLVSGRGDKVKITMLGREPVNAGFIAQEFAFLSHNP